MIFIAIIASLVLDETRWEIDQREIDEMWNSGGMKCDYWNGCIYVEMCECEKQIQANTAYLFLPN